MGRNRSKPKPKAQPPVDVSPFDNDEDDDDIAGGGIPDDDGWIHLEGKEPASEDKKPKRRSARRPS